MVILTRKPGLSGAASLFSTTIPSHTPRYFLACWASCSGLSIGRKVIGYRLRNLDRRSVEVRRRSRGQRRLRASIDADVLAGLHFDRRLDVELDVLLGGDLERALLARDLHRAFHRRHRHAGGAGHRRLVDRADGRAGTRLREVADADHVLRRLVRDHDLGLRRVVEDQAMARARAITAKVVLAVLVRLRRVVGRAPYPTENDRLTRIARDEHHRDGVLDIGKHVPAVLVALHRSLELGPVRLIRVAVIEPGQPNLDPAQALLLVLVLNHDAVVQAVAGGVERILLGSACAHYEPFWAS